MRVDRLRLVNFRSYCDASVSFGAGLNVVVGANATGKTNLLEGAYFALRAGSPRTRRDEKLITWGESFTRVEMDLTDDRGAAWRTEVGYAPRRGRHVRLDGALAPSLDELRRRHPVYIFVPESLLLVKGSPARRRARLDAFGMAVDGGYAAAHRDCAEALRQRNAQLAAVRGGAPLVGLDPWDAQFAHAAVVLESRRAELVERLAHRFAAAAAELAPGGEAFALRLVSQMPAHGQDAREFLAALRERRDGEVRRGVSLYGPQRDDLQFVEVASRRSPDGRSPDEASVDEASVDGRSPDKASADAASADDATRRGLPRDAASCGIPSGTLPSGGRDLRLFGSQGEQRAAVLALLLAERQTAADLGADLGPLFLDDVMSELDDARRRLLVGALTSCGQAIVTTTDRHYFSEAELAAATVIELPLVGARVPSGDVVPATEVSPGGTP